MSRRRAGGWTGLAGLLIAVAAPAHAQVMVPAGADLDLGSGTLALAGIGLHVDGTLAGGNGVVADAGLMRIGSGGVVLGESARFDVLGDWRNEGLFDAGLSVVRLLDSPGADAELTGSTEFSTLELFGPSGKIYFLPSGLTQRVRALLRIQGSAAHPVQLAGSTAGQAAFLNLAETGQQAIANVGVTDVHATGQWLAPNQQNQGGSGNAERWFARGAVAPLPVPVASPAGLILLAVLFVLVAGIRLSSRRRFDLTTRRVS